MIEHFSLLQKLFVTNDSKHSKYWNKLFKGKETSYKVKHSKFIEYLNSLCLEPAELFWRLQHNYEDAPKCRICEQEVHWKNRSYPETCCLSCAGKLRVVNERQKRENDNITDDLAWTSAIPVSRYDNIMKQLLFDETQRGGHSTNYRNIITSPSYLHKYTNIKSYLENRFLDTPGKEYTLYRLHSNLLELPKCKICGQPVMIHGAESPMMYINEYCSSSCKMKDPEVQHNIQEKSLKRTGSVNNASQISASHKAHTKERIDLAIDRRRATNIERGHEANWTNVEQMKATTYDRFGVTCSLLAPEVHEKTVDSLMKKFGVDHQSKSPIVKKKILEANIRYWKNLPQEEKEQRIRHHKEWWDSLPQEEKDIYSIRVQTWWASKTDEELEKISSEFSTAQKRRYANMSDEERKTIGQHVKEAWASKTDEERRMIGQRKQQAILSYLGKFNDEERSAIAQYKSMKSKEWWSLKTDEERHEIYMRGWETKYENGTLNTSVPEERCFKYAKKLFPNASSQDISEVYPFHVDILIHEMNVYIEYQGTWTHGFHPYDPNDKNDVAKAESWKAKGTKYYMSAYYTWTKGDNRKRNIAKKNNLRWYECWTEEECYNLIDKLYEEYVSNEQH